MQPATIHAFGAKYTGKVDGICHTTFLIITKHLEKYLKRDYDNGWKTQKQLLC